MDRHPYLGSGAARWVAGAAMFGLVVAGYAVITQSGDDSSALPPGADDALNRPILIEGGFFWKGNPTPDTVSMGPYITYDETYAPVTVPGFWVQEHEVTNQEFAARGEAGRTYPWRDDRPS